jgi:hypothetical protein
MFQIFKTKLIGLTIILILNLGTYFTLHAETFYVSKTGNDKNSNAFELNQDYAEIDHNLIFGGQHPFAQREGGRTNRKLHIHHNYIANLNTEAHFNAVMRWVGKTDSLSFNNNTIVYTQTPKNPLFFSEKEQGFTHSSFENNLFVNLTDSIRTPVFYSRIKNITASNYSLDFTDLRSTITKDDLIHEQISGFRVWTGKKSSTFQSAGIIMGYSFDGEMPLIGAFEPSVKSWDVGPDSSWEITILKQYVSGSSMTSPTTTN